MEAYQACKDVFILIIFEGGVDKPPFGTLEKKLRVFWKNQKKGGEIIIDVFWKKYTPILR